MGSGEIDVLESGLLLPDSRTEDEDEERVVLYSASFAEMEEIYVKYQTIQWVLYSLLLVLAWGIGLFMLIYIPIRRYILRAEFRSRMLYITPNSIVYKVVKPVAFPCFGVLKKEKHILLPSIADIVIEQGYLQSYFGVYSIRIENASVRRSSSDDVHIHGVANPREFRKVVLTHLANLKRETALTSHGSPSRTPRTGIIPSSGELILQKLEEVGSSVKRVENIIEEQKHPKSQPVD
ncbi:hypothetical protein C5167_041532 [Papaver somniferum]|uniref:uncharacterized protein LOC113327749 n=1 Tax=Papaver somniferum TaxID=3469 RepID=UPI000E70308C|nr:uncharacterized protein LOC113327749 [Papaver somniferum]RZC85351.1 hypothetical protein C5167_041532 [Papaver somniferum]